MSALTRVPGFKQEEFKVEIASQTTDESSTWDSTKRVAIVVLGAGIGGLLAIAAAPGATGACAGGVGGVAGGAYGVFFNNPKNENKIYIEFSEKASPWRVVGKGLNLEAQCETSSCKAYQKMVWIRNGFGRFDIIDIIFERSIKCPICNQKTKDPTNLGFYDCKYKFEGKMLEPERKKVTVEDNAPSNKFTTFKRSDARWASLEITTSHV